MSQCSLAFCCLYQDYFTFVGQPKFRPDAKVVQRDPQCSIAPVALCCKRLHIVRTARKNIVYKRSLQAAPSKPVYFTLQHYFIPKLCRCLNTSISINGLEYIAAHLKCVPRLCVCVCVFCVTAQRCVIGLLSIHPRYF